MKIFVTLTALSDWIFLPGKLREIAELRVNFQDVTLKELGEMVSGGKKISKSGINHRLRKIDEIADKLRAGEI
ncbi:hypothetical protein GCM10020331_027560 [Ectobacillus funiculus]